MNQNPMANKIVIPLLMAANLVVIFALGPKAIDTLKNFLPKNEDPEK